MNIADLLKDIDSYNIERVFIANRKVSFDVTKHGRLIESEEVNVVDFVEALNNTGRKDHIINLIQGKKILYTRYTYKYVIQTTGFYQMFGERSRA